MKCKYVIAEDGSGDYRTLQEAMDAVWNKRAQHWYWRLWYVLFPVRIDVAPGVYRMGEPINIAVYDGPFRGRIEISGCTFEGSVGAKS